VSAGALANLIHNTISLPAFDAIQKICTFEYQHFAADSFVESSPAPIVDERAFASFGNLRKSNGRAVQPRLSTVAPEGER
jgi:hypothetical protein